MRRIPRVLARVLAVVLTALATAGLAVAQKQASLVGTLTGHTDPVYAVAWSPDGKTLATAGFRQHGPALGFRHPEGNQDFEGHTKLVLTVAYSPDGRHLASGSLDNSVRIWDLPATGPARTLTGQAASVVALAVKPDGKQAVAAAGKSVKIWDLAKGTVLKDLGGFAGEVDQCGLAAGRDAVCHG